MKKYQKPTIKTRAIEVEPLLDFSVDTGNSDERGDTAPVIFGGKEDAIQQHSVWDE